MRGIEKLLVITIASISLLTISNVSADNSMSGGSMMHDNNMSSGSMMHDKMMGNMSGSGWGDNGTMMKGENMMMSNSKIDLSMSSPVRGSADAKVTIVEFGDYQCPKCDQWFKNEEPTIKANYIDTNKANLYFMDFPFLGADSPIAAQAVYCANDQGKYWEYHDSLYQNQGAVQSGWASASNLKSNAATLGLDTSQFNSCLDSGKYADRVSHNKAVGTSLGVQGTPAFFIIGPDGTTKEITGPQPAAIFADTIDQISTNAVPEFGTLVSVILVIAIVSVITISKTRLHKRSI
ncbi:MAG: thioredoxin domain-containing protein [Thaumarchaeota archaeon]|nr:thioredoxin domain-containing protein [Nitrososphaerota archaeon]